MMHTYTLVNPFIQDNNGEIETTIEARNSREAASELYKKISKNFAYGVPNFNFTIKRAPAMINGRKIAEKHMHFRAAEKPKVKNKKVQRVDYTIKGINLKENDSMDKFNKKLDGFIKKLDQDGGAKKKKKSRRKKKDSTSSENSILDSDQSVNLINKYYISNQDMVYWWYDPLIYDIKSFYIPTFYPRVVPYYFEVNLDYLYVPTIVI